MSLFTIYITYSDFLVVFLVNIVVNFNSYIWKYLYSFIVKSIFTNCTNHMFVYFLKTTADLKLMLTLGKIHIPRYYMEFISFLVLCWWWKLRKLVSYEMFKVLISLWFIWLFLSFIVEVPMPVFPWLCQVMYSRKKKVERCSVDNQTFQVKRGDDGRFSGCCLKAIFRRCFEQRWQTASPAWLRSNLRNLPSTNGIARI